MQPAPPPQPPPGHLPPGYYPGYPPPPGFAPKKTSLVWLWIALGVVGAVAVIGALAAIAIPSFVNYQRKAKAVEAELALRRIGQAAIMHYEEHGRFPEAAAGPTPAAPCCLGPGQKCAPAIETWAIEPRPELPFPLALELVSAPMTNEVIERLTTWLRAYGRRGPPWHPTQQHESFTSPQAEPATPTRPPSSKRWASFRQAHL